MRGGATEPPNSPARMASGPIEAVFLPAQGMLCASLRHRGEELLRCVEDLDQAATRGSMAGIPLMHPWANRLSGFHYRVAGREVLLDPASPLLHRDGNGLPIHGVPWSRLAWRLIDANNVRIGARLEWNRPELLTIFPFEHALEMRVTLDARGLTLATTVLAGKTGPVPVSFGFHPYIGLPGIARSAWRLTLPPMRRLVLDARGIPTGRETAFAAMDAPLGDLDFDDAFVLETDNASLGISGASRRIRIELLAGYRHVQVYAPQGRAYVALEPMTAPTNALVSGSDLRIVPAGGRFDAAFRICIDTLEG
jgi:aldose 1-epimerase